MKPHRTALLLAEIGLSACLPIAGVAPEAPARADLSAELVRLRDPGPPEGPAGACWASDVTPLVVETVSEQILVSPEQRTADGALIAAAGYRSETRQRIVQERQEIWFRAPCPEIWTPDFIATLQRALKARGYYMHPVTGTLDVATREAVHRFQTDRGLDSPKLSLAAARELGIVEVGRDGL